MSGIPAGAGQLLGKRLGKYEILALLALGGTAEIYLARIGGTAGFEKYVVVKCLHDHLADDTEFVKMFLDEARLAAHLDHSNIVQTMELGQDDGRYYMVMEFLAGLSLAMIVRRVAERLPSGRIPVPLVLSILAQASAGLHYAHDKAMNGKPLNIVHRDISPQNLVVGFEGVVKVVDFGIAKAELRETRTRSGTIKGKFAYMSPEQCVANNVDRRTDVFALGVIAHELLTGRRLFKRASPYETYQAVIECDVKPPSTFDAKLDPALDTVVMRAIAKDKADRYPTAEAFGDALLGYLHHRGISSGPGDIARFFDTHFGQEIEEHSARMRELISGRDVPSVDTGASWGADEPADDAEGDADAGASGTGVQAQTREPGSLEGSRGEEDEMPAEQTRIETNPLEKIDELNRLASSAPARSTAAPARSPTAPAKLPAVPPASSVTALPTPPPGPQASKIPSGMPPSGRFPDLANLPTMIAEIESPEGAPRLTSAPPREAAPPPPRASGFVDAPTALATPSIPPAETGFANAPTAPVDSVVPPPISAPPPVYPGHAPAYAMHAQPNGVPPGVTPPAHPAMPQGYPVMNAQLSAQIATGATVFPSDRRNASPHPASSPGMQPLPPAPPPGARGPELGGMHDGYPRTAPPDRAPDSGPAPAQIGNPVDPQRAANLVGPGPPPYLENTPWGAATFSRVRAAPPWLLAILFIGALGIALALTIAVARMIR